MEISKRQLIYMVRTAHREGLIDGRHQSWNGNTKELRQDMWHFSESLCELREVLRGVRL